MKQKVEGPCTGRQSLTWSWLGRVGSENLLTLITHCVCVALAARDGRLITAAQRQRGSGLAPSSLEGRGRKVQFGCIPRSI